MKVLCFMPRLPVDATQGVPGGKLIPLPIIRIPFEWVGIDIVGPLPTAQWRFTHGVVMVDYATQYPKTIPLWKTRARIIAKELLKVFSQVGFPKEILTDQGTSFMGTVLKALWQLLKVHPLKTSVYHPQTNGLVERFNQTLKRMLRRFIGENPRQWAQLLDPLLFAVQEIPQASIGFSSFELVFCRKPQGNFLTYSWPNQS